MKKTGNILRTVAISTAIALAFLVVISGTVSAEYVADLTVLWSSGLSDNVNAVFVADLDNNGQKEVIAGTRDNKVFLLDSNGNTKWSKTVGSAVTQVYAADTDGDGIKEVIAGTDYNDLGKVYAFDTNGNLQWTFQTGAKHYWPDNKLNVRVIIAGDVDNDAKEEVVVGSTHYYWFPSRICVLGENGILEGEYWNPGYMYSIEISDLENDGSNEIIAGFVNNDYGYEGAVAVFDGNNVGGEAPAYANGFDYNAGTQRWYWHSGVDHSSINSIYAFDVGADGDKEIVCGAQDNRVYLLNSNGGVVWTYATAGTVSSVYAADIDADGKGEIIAGSSDKNMYCLEHTKSLKWKYQTGGSARIPFAGDLDNDGASEIVAVSDKVYVLNSAGKLKYSYSGSGKVYVADLGTDGTKEIVLGSGASVYALSATVSDALSPEANLDIILKLASYYDESSDYVSNNWDKAVEIYNPSLTDKERQDIQNELAKKFPKLDFTAEEIAEEIINFQYYISNIIIEGKTVTFTKADKGTLVNDNGVERSLDIQIPFDKIELKASLGKCVMTVTSGDTQFSMMLEPFCDLGGCGIEMIYDLDVSDVGIGASLTAAIFAGPGLSLIGGITPGMYVELSIDTPDHTITILLNDPFSLKNANASAGVYVGYDLSGYTPAFIGGGGGVDVGTFVSLTPTDINPADVTDVAVDVAETLSDGLSDLGGPKEGDPVEVAVGTGLDVIEKVSSSLPPSAKVGVELGAEGKLGLGLGAKVGRGGAKASVDGMGAVSSSTTMPLNIFGAVISTNKKELTTFYSSSIKAFPIIVEVYDVSQHPDILRLFDACKKLPDLAGYLWTAFNSAKEIDISEDNAESVKVGLDFGAGIGGEIVAPVYWVVSGEAGGKGQYSAGAEINLKTLIAAITLDTTTLWDRGYFGGMITEGAEVSGGAGAVGGPGVDVKVGVSKEIIKISVQGNGGGGGVGSLALRVDSLEEQSDVDLSVISDHGIDTNGDGFYDYLAVDVSLNVSTPDNYSVGGMLFRNLTCVGFALNTTYLDAGRHNITLKFDGIHLRNQRINGSYDFGSVLGREGKNDSLFISFSLYNTTYYNYTDFQKSYLNITDLSYSGIDTDGNGLYDYLNIDIDLNSTKDGKANITGILMGENLVLENETSSNIAAGTSTLNLLFDGKGVRSGGSGTYILTITVYNEKGAILDSLSRNVVLSYLNFELPNAALFDFYADKAVDADDDGLYDYLAVDVGVNVSVPGNYTVDAYLRGNGTSFYLYNSTFLESDDTVTLVVDGLIVRNSLKNQNYSLINVRLYQNNTLLAVRKNPYNTSAYNYSSFKLPKATLTDNYSDQGVDMDGDGLYDYLGIDVELKVTKPEVYKISGFLKCNQSYISAEKQISLEAGNHTVTLLFDGEAIYGKGYSGRYHLERVGIIQNGVYIDYMNRIYNTSIYNYTDFEKVNKPPIANFTYSPEKPVINQTIIFNASLSNDPDGNITLYEWDFGDGSNATGVIVNHSYLNAGNYTVTLKVTDNGGAENTITKEVKVSSIISLPLTSGWNLISVPLNLTSWKLGNESLVGDPLNVTPKNSLTSIYRYNATSGLFEKCDHFDDWGWWPATGSESFTELEPGRGYWVMAKNDCNLTFTGTAPSDLNVTVKKG